MTIKKGDTIYLIETGEPRRVTRTRKLGDGLTRVWPGSANPVDWRDGEATCIPRGYQQEAAYTTQQTPELAQRWADTLREREQERAERERERATYTANVTANLDAYNAAPVVGELEMPAERHEYAELSFVAREVEPDAKGLPREQSHRFRVSVASTRHGYQLDTDGEVDSARVVGVNWSACGTQHPAIARAYARAILAAADLAEQMNAQPEEVAQ